MRGLMRGVEGDLGGRRGLMRGVEDLGGRRRLMRGVEGERLKQRVREKV